MLPWEVELQNITLLFRETGNGLYITLTVCWNDSCMFMQNVQTFSGFSVLIFRENPVWETLVEWLMDSLRKESLNSHACGPREVLVVSVCMFQL